MCVKHFLQCLCLKPKYSLRRQLIVSFGSIAAITIILTVILATNSSIQGGNVVKDNARNNLLKNQVEKSTRLASRYQADLITEKINSFRSAATLIVEIVRDRIVGYPNDNFEDDRHVPFQDVLNNNNLGSYPFRAIEPLPRDWEIELNLRPDNLIESAQERAGFFSALRSILGTTHGSLFFAGNCDPSETDPQGMGYHPNCTDANNDLETGGVIHNNSPDVVRSTKYLGEKASDIAVYLKPLWEAEPDILITSVAFLNRGAGLWMGFPGAKRASTDSYISIGCDWLRTINPYTGRPLATEEEIARCSPEGTVVPARLYNPMEREFCKDQALNPGETRVFGPYEGANAGFWWLTIGQSIFDRRTGEFIGCATLDMSTNVVEQFLEKSTVGNFTSAELVRSDGIVVSGEGQAKPIWETNIVDKATFDLLANVIDWDGERWDPADVQERLFESAVEYQGNILAAYPIPTPPHDKYDPNYRPEFYVVLTTSNGVFEVIDDIDTAIDDDVSKLVFRETLIGAIGLVLVFVLVWSVSRTLTIPLEWMESISSRIVNHTDKEAAEELRAIQQWDTNTINTGSINSSRRDSGAMSLRSSMRNSIAGATAVPSGLGQWLCIGGFTPTTEITFLVAEFQKMIRGFSGKGAPTVARTTEIQEIANVIPWQAEFQELYCRETTNNNDDSKGYFTPINFSLSKSKPLHSGTINVDGLRPNVMQSVEFDGGSNPIKRKGGNPNEAMDLSSSNGCDKDNDLPSHESFMDEHGTEDSMIPVRTSPLDRCSHSSQQEELRIPLKINQGQNLEELINEDCHQESQSTILEHMKPASSSLFWWIVALIMVPISLTNIIICGTVSVDLLLTVPSWVDSAETLSEQVEIESLTTTALLSASYAEAVLDETIRDLYIFTRVSQYVILNVVDRKKTLPDTEIKFVEECKVYPKDQSCPFYKDETRHLCDCEWQDIWGYSCKDYETNTRYRQKPWLACQATDEDPVTGNRYIPSTYPQHSTSADTTQWHDEVSEMAGFGNNNDLTSNGYNTTYDRLRALGAMSAIAMSLYNYPTSARNLLPRSKLAFYFSFDADGSFWGYDGCESATAGFSYFQSNDDNKAFEIRPDLCPKGKFGYDARCRSWYDDGKRKWIQNKKPLYITPPYNFAASSLIGMSAGAIVPNPSTGDVIGQTLVDFTPSRLIDAISNTTNTLFSFIITPAIQGGGDTLLGPGHAAGDTPELIEDVVTPNDPQGSSNRQAFSELVAKMKAGEFGTGQITRTNTDGTTEELLVAFAPVFARSLTPVRPDQFRSGANVTQTLVYSVGVVGKLSAVKQPFNEIVPDIEKSLRLLTALLISLVAFILIMCIMFTSQVSIIVTIPMIVLLRVVQNVNDGRINEDLPSFEGGSGEANQVYSSFAKLYKIVRVANKAFFSGDLQWAYSVIYDAMRLFRKVNDHKAIGVVCNNLGSTLFAISQEHICEDDCHFVNGVCCVKSAIKYLNEAVTVATVTYERYNSEESKASYGFLLADRHFNRALCLLNSGTDRRCCPRGAVQIGFTDLQKARGLDKGSKSIWEQRGLLFKYSDVYFDRLLRRMHGLAVISRVEPNVWKIWNPSELVDEANQFLARTWNNRTLPIYEDMNQVGRLQQLECAVMNLEISMGDTSNAAKIGMRMIAEDEYMIDMSYAVAAEAILRHTRQSDCSWPQQAAFNSRCDLLNGLKSCKGGSISNTKSLIFCFEISDKLKDHYFVTCLNKSCLGMFDEICTQEDYAGIIAFGDHLQEGKIEEFSACKANGRHRLRRRLDSATFGSSGQSGCPALPAAAQMMEDASAHTEAQDTYLLFITDGTLWDEKSLSLMVKEMKEHWNNNSSVHIIVIALELQQPDQSIKGVVDLLQELSQMTPQSMYIEANRSSISSVLAKVNILLSAQSYFVPSSLRLCLTMEKF